MSYDRGEIRKSENWKQRESETQKMRLEESPRERPRDTFSEIAATRAA